VANSKGESLSSVSEVELDSAAKLQNWLSYARLNRPDRENLLWPVGYENAPIHSDWLEEVLAELAELRADQDPQ